MNDVTCASCGRVVKEINYHYDLGTCLYCDLTQEGMTEDDL